MCFGILGLYALAASAETATRKNLLSCVCVIVAPGTLFLIQIGQKLHASGNSMGPAVCRSRTCVRALACLFSTEYLALGIRSLSLWPDEVDPAEVYDLGWYAVGCGMISCIAFFTLEQWRDGRIGSRDPFLKAWAVFNTALPLAAFLLWASTPGRVGRLTSLIGVLMSLTGVVLTVIICKGFQRSDGADQVDDLHEAEHGVYLLAGQGTA